MEEVDAIILHFLRQLNINVDDSTKNICELPVETIIEAASTCLRTINPSLKIPVKLPLGISQRIEVAAQIALICKLAGVPVSWASRKQPTVALSSAEAEYMALTDAAKEALYLKRFIEEDLGYKNDVGYQTFLYYNECDLRHVFMFLIERLPNEGKQTTTTSVPTNKKSLLMENIRLKIKDELNSIWIPPSCNKTSQIIGDFVQTPVTWNNTGSRISLSEKEIMQMLLRITESNINASDKLTTQEKPERAPDKEVDMTFKINKSLKDLKEMAIVLRQKLDTLESERNVMEVEHFQVRKSCERVEADLKNVHNILNSIGLSGDETESAAGSLFEKVEHNIIKLHRKSEDLTSRNLSLKVEIDKLKNTANNSESERVKCKKILNNLKETAREMKEEFDKKEELKNQYKNSYEKLRGGNKRSIYTKRILEIISNVDKQNMEINKILDDTRQLQKEINSLEGQLDRCFSIADETLFRDAKKDDQAKKAYKLLALLHSECNTIVSLVNDSGALARDIVDLEENIKTESAKRTEDTLKKIHVDLTRIQEES